MTIEELKVRLCEEIKFTGVGYKNMCEVLDEFSEDQKTAHNSDNAKLKEALEIIADYGGSLNGEDAHEMKQIATEALQ